MLKRLQVKVRTPSPPAPEHPPSSELPLKTPSNVLKLNRLQKQRQKETSPTDRAVQKIIRGCQIAIHNAALLRKENSRLRNENGRRKRKQAIHRKFIQTGGSITVEEGITYTKARQTRRRNQVTHKEAEEEVPDIDRPIQAAVDATIPVTIPATQKRASPKYSTYSIIRHTTRTCLRK